MTTAVTSTVIDHSTDAGYNTWVSEIITMLFTTLGLTQTTDTGQTTGSGLTRPAVSTMNAYIVGRFNDTAQSTTPIFFRIDFGTGNSTSSPAMRLTVGGGSNGSGTITTPYTLTAMGVTNASAPSSTVTPYVTRACYNGTAGVFWFAWKVNAGGTTNQCLGGWIINRSADNTGAVTTDAVNIMTNSLSANTNGSTNSECYMCAFSHLTSIAYNVSSGGNSWPNPNHSYAPFLPSGFTLFSGNAQVLPAFQYTPVIGVTPWWGLALYSELGMGSTQTLTIVGSTSHTYINAGSLFGVTSTFGPQSLSMTSTWGIVALWE
jgi:hypothetical protein